MEQPTPGSSKFSARRASPEHGGVVDGLAREYINLTSTPASVSTSPPRSDMGPLSSFRAEQATSMSSLSVQLANMGAAIESLVKSQEELTAGFKAEMAEVRRDISNLHFTMEAMRVSQPEGHGHGHMDSHAQEEQELKELSAMEARLASAAHQERRGPSQRTSHIARLSVEDGNFVLPVWQVGKSVDQAADSGFAMVRKDSFEENAKGASRTWLEQKIMLHPECFRRLLWDTASAVLVLYDIVVLPMSFLPMESNIFLDAMAWLSRVFWTCDMGMSLITGYVNKDSSLELRFRNVLFRYCVTWLCLDSIIVGVDWMELFGEADGSDVSALRTGKASRASKIFRLIRMLRLLRMLRIGTSILSLGDRIATERLVVVFYIIISTLGILSMSHLVACFWYGIGDADGGWVRRHGEELGIGELPLDYGYVTALHWALTQFSGHMDEIAATTLSERLFSDVVKVLSLDVCVMLISGIAALLVRLSILAMDDETRLAKLRQFMKCNRISASLVQKIQRSANYGAARARQQMSEAEVEMLPFVTDDLLLQLHAEVRAPFVSSHPLFDVFKCKVPQLLRRVSHSTMKDIMVDKDTHLFHVNDKLPDPKMYFVVTGDLRYVSAGTVTVLEEQEWVAEMVLWMDWTHPGSLRTVSRSRMFAISARDFWSIAGEYRNPSLKLKKYAKVFARTLMDIPAAMRTDLSQNNEDAAAAVVWEEIDRGPKKFRKTALPFK